MTRFLFAAVAFSLLAFARQAPGACGWFGTQLECGLGNTDLSVGTQVAEPACAGVPALALDGRCDELVPARPTPAWPFVIKLQNVGADSASCWRLGDETYCY